MKKCLAYSACGLAVGGMAAAYLHGAVADARNIYNIEREYSSEPRTYRKMLGAVIKQDLRDGQYPRWLLQRAAKRLGH